MAGLAQREAKKVILVGCQVVTYSSALSDWLGAAMFIVAILAIGVVIGMHVERWAERRDRAITKADDGESEGG